MKLQPTSAAIEDTERDPTSSTCRHTAPELVAQDRRRRAVGHDVEQVVVERALVEGAHTFSGGVVNQQPDVELVDRVEQPRRGAVIADVAGERAHLDAGARSQRCRELLEWLDTPRGEDDTESVSSRLLGAGCPEPRRSADHERPRPVPIREVHRSPRWPRRSACIMYTSAGRRASGSAPDDAGETDDGCDLGEDVHELCGGCADADRSGHQCGASGNGCDPLLGLSRGLLSAGKSRAKLKR